MKIPMEIYACAIPAKKDKGIEIEQNINQKPETEIIVEDEESIHTIADLIDRVDALIA